MYLSVLTHTETDMFDYYVNPAVPYYRNLLEWEEIDEDDIGTYLICGCTFNRVEEIKEFETSPDYIWLIIEDWGKEYIWRDYSDEEWAKMVKDFILKHDELVCYSVHSDAYVC